MLMTDFYSDFTRSFDNGDLQRANIALMKSLGMILVKNRVDFVHLLNESNIEASTEMSDMKLVNLFIDNVAGNQNLILGASILVNHHNRQMNFDGDNTMDDRYVKGGYIAITDCFPWLDDSYSNAIDPVTAIAETIGKGVDLGSKGLEGRQKGKYGLQDALIAKQQSKNAMTQQVLVQRQQEIDAKKQKDSEASKTSRTVLIVTGAVIGLAIIGYVIYSVKKKK